MVALLFRIFHFASLIPAQIILDPELHSEISTENSYSVHYWLYIPGLVVAVIRPHRSTIRT